MFIDSRAVILQTSFGTFRALVRLAKLYITSLSKMICDDTSSEQQEGMVTTLVFDAFIAVFNLLEQKCLTRKSSLALSLLL